MINQGQGLQGFFEAYAQLLSYIPNLKDFFTACVRPPGRVRSRCPALGRVLCPSRIFLALWSLVLCGQHITSSSTLAVTGTDCFVSFPVF